MEGPTVMTSCCFIAETSPVAFQTTPDDPLIKRVETVGKVQPHVKAKIVNEHGEIVPVNTPGELHAAGYLLQKGCGTRVYVFASDKGIDAGQLIMNRYWRDEEQTARAMKKDANGTLWMHTGDEAIMDEEGYLKSKSRFARELTSISDQSFDKVVGRIKVSPNTFGTHLIADNPRP